MRRPLTGVLIVLILGITLGKIEMLHLLIALCLLSLGLIVLYPNKKGVILMLIPFFIIGYYSSHRDISENSQLEWFHNKEIIIDAHIVKPIVERENKQDIYLEIKRIDGNGKSYSLKETEVVLASIYRNEDNPDINLSPGDIINFEGKVRMPKGLRNPGGFDYGLYLKTQGVYTTLTINPQSIEIKGHESLGFIEDAIYQIKGHVQEIINKNLSKDHGALLKGILFGDKELDDSIRNAFVDTGIAHVLAVSGLHVGFLIAGVIYISKALKFSNPIKLFVFTLALIFYIVITGAAPSVIRASIMAWISLLAGMFHKKYDGISALSLSGLLILLPNPLLVFTASFQLSFLAALSIILFYPVFLEYLQKIKFMPDSIATLLAVTIAAQVGTLPSSLFHFHQTSIISIITNLLIIPAMGVLLFVSVMAIIFYSFIPILGSYLFFISSFVFSAVIGVARIFSSFPFASIHFSPFTWVEIMIYTLLLLMIGTYIPMKIKKNRLFFFLILFILFIYEIIIFLLPSPLVVTFLDVNQGDSILIQTPQNKNIFIDGGGYPSYQGNNRKISEDVLLPLFYSQSLKKIDLALITHPHDDHMKGIEELIGRVPIEALGIYDIENEDLHRVKSLGIEENIPIISLKEQDIIHIEKNLKIEILWPGSDLQDNNINNASLVSRLDYGDISFLFTGDIEKEAEEEILRRRKNIQANILKVAHHGSNTSSNENFIKEVNPNIAIIQVGENNTFGHPHAYTLDQLESITPHIYRTDERGAIEISTNGSWIKIKTYIDGK